MRTCLILALFALALTASAQLPDKGYWRAASNTANSITGDIDISDAKLTINFTAFHLVQARTLTAAEVSAVFDADVNAGPTGTLYHVPIPANKRFLHHNTLCGTEDTEWMATYASGPTLQVAFFSGTDAPVITFDTMRNSTSLCGTFTYQR